MSQFSVTVTRIKELKAHPAADRLELARVEAHNYPLVAQKGIYQVGQEVVYFPIDSLLPEAVIDKLDLWGKDENGQVIRDEKGRVAKTMLAGKDQNRVHSAVLRGEPSQGFMCPAFELFGSQIPPVGADVTALLGVTKYEPPEIKIDGAVLTRLPDLVGVYDVEHAEYYPDVVAALMDEPVLITEKLEGINYGVGLYADRKPFVFQRTSLIVETPTEGEPENLQWKVARKSGLVDFVSRWPLPIDEGSTVVLRGEMIGPGVPASSFYGLKEPTVRLFDIKVGVNYLDALEFLKIIPQELQVPVLSKGDKTLREWLAGRTLAEASNGPSALNPLKLREGIVIRPLTERMLEVVHPKRENPDDPTSPIIDYIPARTRAIIKQRSPKYLAKGQ